MKKAIFTTVLGILAVSFNAQAAPPTDAGNPYKGTGNPFVSIKAETNELYASVDTLEQRVTLAEQNISTLQAKAKDLQEQILFNSSNIDANSHNIQSNTQDIESLKAELIATNQQIYKLQMDLKQLEAVVALKQDIIEGKCPDGQYISEIKPDGSLICEYDTHANGLRRLTVYTQEYLNGCFCWPGQACSCPTRPAGTISANCPSGSVAVSGGHSADLSVNVTFSGLRGNSWQVDAGLYPLFLYSGGNVVVHANCIALQ